MITCERCGKVYDKGYSCQATTRYEAQFDGWEYKDGKDTCLRCKLLKRPIVETEITFTEGPTPEPARIDIPKGFPARAG